MSVSQPPSQETRPEPQHNLTESRISTVFQSKVDFYAASMHDNFGWLSRLVLGWLFRPIRLDEPDVARVKKLAEDGVVVYVCRTRSKLDYLIYNFKFNEHGLPLARFSNAINMMAWQPLREMLKTALAKGSYLVRGRRMPPPHKTGFLKDLTLSGKSSLIFLKRPDTLFDRWLRPLWDPMISLIRAQRQMERPILLMPQMVLWEKRPGSLRKSLFDFVMGPRLDPGRIRKALMFLRHRKHAFVRIGEPVNLADFLLRYPEATEEELARKLRWVLRTYLFRELRVILGPVHKPRARVLEKVLRKMQPDLERIASKTGQKPEKVSARALDCLEEIAADPDHRYPRLWKRVMDWALGLLYDEIEHIPQEQIEQLKQLMKTSPVVLIPNHRSHLDYLLISYYMYCRDITTPLIAAGKNLSFWPMGHIFRKSGAFFIRRRFGGDPVYPAAFRHYTAHMLREGFPMMFFIEGTRSRSGKMLTPKLGLLSMAVETFMEASTLSDLTLVPVAVTYDKVVEEASLMRELSGAPKKAESIFGMLSIHKLLQRKHGRLSLRLGQPISLEKYLTDHSVEPGNYRSVEFRTAVEKLGRQVTYRISAALLVHPSTLLASVLLCHREGIVAYGELLRGTERLIEYLNDVGAPLSEGLRQLEKGLADAISLFQNGGLIKLERELDAWGRPSVWGGVLTLDPRKRPVLDYYRNNTLHHFVPLSLLCRALLADPERRDWEGVARDVAFMLELLGQEFASAPGADWQVALAGAAEYLERKRLLVREGDTFEIAERSRRTLRFFERLTAPMLESYRTTLRFLSLLERRALRPQKEVLSLIQFGEVEFRRGRIHWPESICTSTYQNALAYFKGHADRGFEHFRRRLDSLSNEWHD